MSDDLYYTVEAMEERLSALEITVNDIEDSVGDAEDIEEQLDGLQEAYESLRKRTRLLEYACYDLIWFVRHIPLTVITISSELFGNLAEYAARLKEMVGVSTGEEDAWGWRTEGEESDG
jgi:hypothetical protein